MPTGTARPLAGPPIRVVRFYKMDHLGDPVLLANGRVRLGVQDCKHGLRAGIKEPDLERRDNLIISIGGITAEHGLRDRLVWAGIPVGRTVDGSIDCEGGFCPLQDGTLAWRAAFPLIAAYVDTVGRWHRVGRVHVLKGELVRHISPTLCREFIRLFEWGKRMSKAPPPPSTPRGRPGGCPPPADGGRPRVGGRRVCPPPKSRGC